MSYLWWYGERKFPAGSIKALLQPRQGRIVDLIQGDALVQGLVQHGDGFIQRVLLV